MKLTALPPALEHPQGGQAAYSSSFPGGILVLQGMTLLKLTVEAMMNCRVPVSLQTRKRSMQRQISQSSMRVGIPDYLAASMKALRPLASNN